MLLATLIFFAAGCQQENPTVGPQADAVTAQRLAPSSPEATASPPMDFKTLPKAVGKPSRYDSFVGTEVCAQCHLEKAKLWAGSVHGRAGGPPSPSTVVPAFDGRPLRFSDGQIVPTLENGRYLLRVERTGIPTEVYPIEGVIGRGWMHGGGGQTFISRQADGRVVPLPLEYNVTGQRWYCQLVGAEAGWTPVDGSFSLEACGWPPGRSIGFAPGRPAEIATVVRSICASTKRKTDTTLATRRSRSIANPATDQVSDTSN